MTPPPLSTPERDRDVRAEYSLAIERINDVADTTLSMEDRERLQQILGEYEIRRNR